MASEVLPAGVSVDSAPIYLPQLFQSSRPSRRKLAGRIRQGELALLACIDQKLFPRSRRETNRRSRTMCIPFPRKSFSACWLLDVAKHSVDVHVHVGVDVGVSASATRASFLFLSKLLPRKSFLCHFYPSSLPLGRFFLPLFAIDRGSSFSFAFLPPSSKAFRRV